MKSIVPLLFLMLMSVSCATNRDAKSEAKPEAVENSGDHFIGTVLDSKIPKAIIYKTKANYNDLVPVTMDESKTSIVSYPAPSDIVLGDGYATPTELEDGYLLDNRGITPNTAFLDYTYEEYAKLDPYPTADELLEHVSVKYPFVEMYYVGRKFSPDRVKHYNEIVKSKFAGCEKVELK